MSEALFSGSWYRVKDLTPRLRSHAEIHRHRYRGETWYVLQDPANDRFHRFTPTAHYVIGIMDGRRTVEEIWTLATDQSVLETAPGYKQKYNILSSYTRYTPNSGLGGARVRIPGLRRLGPQERTFGAGVPSS